MTSRVDVIFYSDPMKHRDDSNTVFRKPSLGHVALRVLHQQQDEYVSFWPNAEFRTLEADKEKYEKKERFTLLDLDTQKIVDAAYRARTQNTYSWTPFGSSPYKSCNESNCVDLTLSLLEQGGFQSHIRGKQNLYSLRKSIFCVSLICTVFCGLVLLRNYISNVENRSSNELKKIKLTYDHAKDLLKQAGSVLSLFPSSRNKLRKNTLAFVTMLMSEALHGCASTMSEAEKIIREYNRYVRILSMIGMVIGSPIAYFCYHLLDTTLQTITVGDLKAEIEKKASKNGSEELATV